MKKVIFALLLPILTFSQIEVKEAIRFTEIGHVKKAGMFFAEIKYSIDKQQDTTYYYVFKNEKYSTLMDIKIVSFGSQNNTLNELYKLYKLGFAEENRNNKDFSVRFKLGTSDVYLSSYKIMGIVAVTFNSPDGYITFTEKEVDRLFGKR